LLSWQFLDIFEWVMLVDFGIDFLQGHC
jgi:hypothetical protein